jgi:hypothetical protein
MANGLLSWINHVDVTGAELSASSTAGDLAIDNVTKPIARERFRTQSLTATINVDWLQDRSVGALAIRFLEDFGGLPTSGTVRHRLDADGGTPGNGSVLDTGTINVGAQSGFPYHLRVPSSEQTARYWQIDFDVSGVSFIDIGRLWAGPVFRPDPNVAYGYDDGYTDASTVNQANRSGIETVDEGTVLRRFRFALEAMGDSDRKEARDLKRIAGQHGQVLFSLDPDNPSTETIIGRLRQLRPISFPNPAFYRTQFTIEESA